MGIYLLGDMHGDWRKITYLCKNLTKNDIVIQLGDHGVNYYGTGQDDNLKKKIAKLDCTFIFLRGNHDRNHSQFKGYSFTDFDKGGIKGKFYINGKYPNQLFTPMYGMMEIKDNKMLFLCGSYSVDKWYRIHNGWNWFEDEQLSENEKLEVLEILESQNDFDYVLSHTCPYKYRPTHLFLDSIDQSTVDNSMEHFLQDVESQINYRKWFFGHFHNTEKCWDKGMMIYENLIPLEEILNE
jgi:3-oxoacid CoA-transferase subunit A